MFKYYARDQPLHYPHCDRTVTVYHTVFNPFSCRRVVLQGVYYETRPNVEITKSGVQHTGGYLLIIPQKAGARVSPAADVGVEGTYVLQPATGWLRASGRKFLTAKPGPDCCPAAMM